MQILPWGPSRHGFGVRVWPLVLVALLASHTGVIYLDDGHSIAYRQGAFLRQMVRCSRTAAGIEIQFDAREGQFQPWWSRIEVRVHEIRGRARAELNGRPLQSAQTSKSRTLTVLIDDQRGPARLSIDLDAGAPHPSP
jgi:alpha-glucosidase